MNANNICENKKDYKAIIDKYTSERAFFLYVVLFMVTIPLGELISELIGIVFVTQPFIHMIFGYIGIIMALLRIFRDLQKRDLRISDIFYMTLLFFLFISYIFSHERQITPDRATYEEIMPNFFSYYSLLFAATHIETYKLRKKVLFVFLGLAFFESVICFFQTIGLRIMDSCFDPEMHAADNLSFGLAQHQNFYGGLSVLFFGACVGVLIFYVNKKMFFPTCLLTALVLYGSLSTSARLTWIGNITILFFVPISILIMKNRIQENGVVKRYFIRYIIVLALSVVTVAIIIMTSDKIQGEITQTMREADSVQEFATDTLNPVTDVTPGNGRVYLWKFAFEALPDNWLTGVGPDNLRWCFLNSPRWHEGMWYNDKAHCEYIHIMTTLGIPALINYLLMLIFAAVTAVKNIYNSKEKYQNIITWIFLGMMAGYMTQAMVNSSVINTTMYFWITVGMTMPRFSQRRKFENGG